MTAAPAVAREAAGPLPRAAASTSSSFRRLAVCLVNVLALTTLIQPAMAHPPPPPVEIQSNWVNAAYYPNWHLYKGLTPASMPLGQISHVLYAFIGVNTDGSLKHLDEHADLVAPADGVQGGLAALAQAKANHGHLRTLISVGGGNSSTEFAALAANPEARARFASEIRGFVDKYRFNGVDIDWEYPTDPEQGQHYALLLEAIRHRMPAGHYMLTTALPPGQWILRNLDIRRVAAVLDYMNLMCYDLTGPWSDVSGNHAQLLASTTMPSDNPTLKAACSDGISYLMNGGFPAHKIVMGIPVYARTFPAARGPGQSTANSGEIDYMELPQEYVERAFVDNSAAAASYVDETNGFTTFDTPRSVTIKANYVRQRCLGGLFYWTGSSDRKGKESLVVTGFNALHGYGWLL